MNKIFLDNNSTTPIDSDVLEAMIPFFKTKFGNSSSKTHSFGWEAEASVEIAREQIANLIHCESNQIVFTSGATESNNIVLLNTLNQDKKHIITMNTEHKAIIDICNHLNKSHNIDITYMNPNKNGIVDIKKLKKLISNKTYLVSIMHANNEIGVVQPIEKIGEICKENNILFHVDAAQSLGKIDINVKKMNIDFLSISGHKIYGPKGIGALYYNHRIKPIIYGGNQEKSIRPGTLPVPLIVGFGKACQIAKYIMKSESKKILKLRNILLEKIINKYPNTIVNGDIKNRIAGNLNLSFPILNGQSIVTSMSKIAISSGSACTSSSPKPSHVLIALGLSKKLANSSIRVGIGRFNTKNEILIAAQEIIDCIKRKVNVK